jgi:NAD+ kinase
LIAAGKFTVSERLRVEAEVLCPRRTPKKLVALNEVAVHTGTIARVVDLNVTVDGEQVLSYDGDGIIISTPTGSTAYSLAAGGPIVAPGLKAMIITPVSPHTLAARPLVIAPESVIEVDVLIRQHKASLTADGQAVNSLHNGDRVRIRHHRFPFKLIELGTRDRYQPVRDNLGWISGSKK